MSDIERPGAYAFRDELLHIKAAKNSAGMVELKGRLTKIHLVNGTKKDQLVTREIRQRAAQLF